MLRLLGPVRWETTAGSVDLGTVKQRAVLAALAVDAGHLVPWSDLIDRVWDQTLAAEPRRALYTYASRIRRLLDHVNAADHSPPARLIRQSGGYRLEIDPDRVDLHRFHRLVAAAGQPAPDGERARLLAEALDLWRGRPLADLPGEWPQRISQAWRTRRLDAAVAWAEAQLRLGEPQPVIGRVGELATEHPLVEPLMATLIQGLAAAGRRAEALDCYAGYRARLVEELGAEPGPRLRDLHQAVLRGAIPDARHAPASPTPVDRSVPAQLPAAVPAFTGRREELAQLDAVSEVAAATAVTVVISGTAGVGKTALAVQWAHRVAELYPDGQLYVNLRGYDPDQPMPAADALAGFLRALGVPGQDIPTEVDEGAARYRGLLAGKRVLVVLDNAGSADQVRPLLPGAPSCAVVVTSRDALAGLVARDGATRLDLDLLPLPDAILLLRMLIGARVDAAPDAAAELADQCSRLPLALRVAAELATSHRDVPLSDLTAELAGLHKRLDLLTAGGDRRTAVRAVFSWSYRHLTADAAATFRLLGLHPGPDFEPYAAAALTGRTVEQAHEMLDVLTRANLISFTAPGRHGMHDLLRGYARELAATEDTTQLRHAALARLFDHYLGTAAAAMDALFPAEHHWRPRVAAPGTLVPPITGPAAALGWLDAQRATLVAVTAHAAEHGWPAHATRLADTLARYLEHGSHYPEAVTVHTHARIAARQAGDAAAEAAALKVLGLVASHQGRYQQATGHLEQALALFRQTGDRTGQARSLTNLGIASYLQGRWAQAGRWWQQSLSVHQENSDQAGQSSVLGNLGLLDLRQGRYRQASRRLGESLALARITGGQRIEFTALVNLGEVSLRQGAYQDATRQLHQALALARELSDRNHEASALVRLGEVCLRQGRHVQASSHLERALALVHETGDKEDEAEALNGFGEILTDKGQPEHARARHAAALELASQIGGKYQQARAHSGLARAHHAVGAIDEARRHWQQALRLYTDLGAPEAYQVRAHLTAADNQNHREP